MVIDGEPCEEGKKEGGRARVKDGGGREEVRVSREGMYLCMCNQASYHVT